MILIAQNMTLTFMEIADFSSLFTKSLLSDVKMCGILKCHIC